MTFSREFPERPIVGVGGVVIEDSKVLLIRRGSEPLKGRWSIPGGTLELGETLKEGVARELLEETGLEVRVLDLIELFERINLELPAKPLSANNRTRFHFVIADYLCERIGGELRAGGDALDVVLACEEDLRKFELTALATSVIQKAFVIGRSRHSRR